MIGLNTRILKTNNNLIKVYFDQKNNYSTKGIEIDTINETINENNSSGFDQSLKISNLVTTEINSDGLFCCTSNEQMKYINMPSINDIQIANDIIQIGKIHNFTIKNIISVDSDSNNTNNIFVLLTGIMQKIYCSNSNSNSNSDSDSDSDSDLDHDSISDANWKYDSVDEAYINDNKNEFYCIMINNGLVIKIIPIDEKISVDQIPTKILFISPLNCIICGTKGLLLNISAHIETSICINKANTINEEYIDIISAHITLTLITNSNHNNILITNICYYNNYLLSGDSQGTICLWRLCRETQCWDQVCNSLCLNNEYIVDFQILTSFSNVSNVSNDNQSMPFIQFTMSTHNKLFLINYNYNNDSNLTIRHCLNTSSNSFSKYYVMQYFNMLKIFRISDAIINNSQINIVVICIKKQALEYQLIGNNDLIQEHEQYNTTSTYNVVHNPIFDNITSFDPISQEDSTALEHIEKSNDNIIIKLKDTHYSTSKQLIRTNMATYSENVMKKIGIPAGIINTKSLKRALTNSSQYFEINDDKIWVKNKFQKVYNANNKKYVKLLNDFFDNELSQKFKECKPFLAIFCAYFEKPVPILIFNLLNFNVMDILNKYNNVDGLFMISNGNIQIIDEYTNLDKWLICKERINGLYWIDVDFGHNMLCSLYFKYYANKSITYNEPGSKSYLNTYGYRHFHNSSRGLKDLCQNVHKIDETIKLITIPRQIGYLTNLEFLYHRGTKLKGHIPDEICDLEKLQVVSLGNNQLSGQIPKRFAKLENMQRLVLHCNNLEGDLAFFANNKYIVNVANNATLQIGTVHDEERTLLVAFFEAFKGNNWLNKTNWCSPEPVSKWNKVGVLNGHVETIVITSNNLEGNNFDSLIGFSKLKMIELSCMPKISGSIYSLCHIQSLQRLCICNCGLTGSIPEEIGNLVNLVELQLFGNQMIGSIPETIGNLINLKLLSFGEYTGGNNFISGPIPSSMSKLVKLQALFLANCNLSGQISDWIGNCLINLQRLDLQNNKLTGPLPQSLSNLIKLMYLNIKDNKLNGLIHVNNFTNLTRLNRLSLVNNNFTNADQIENQFSTLLPMCKVWT
jgi:hypothetical protein